MMNPADRRLKINVRLLRRMQRAILRWPEAFSMATAVGMKRADLDAMGIATFLPNTPMKFNPQTMKEPTCGSACCLFGWAVILGDEKPLAKRFSYDQAVFYRAQELLGLTDDQAYLLYKFIGNKERLQDVTPQEAAAAIDRFIANPLAERL